MKIFPLFSRSRASQPQLFALAVVLGCAWWFHSQVLKPRQLRIEESERRVAVLQQQLVSARQALGEIKTLEQEAGRARSGLNHLVAENAEESAMVAFPTQIKRHFAQFGLILSVVRLNSTRPDLTLAGYQWLYWSVGVPIPKSDRNASDLLLAVADAERQAGFIRVIDFTLQADPEDPSQRVASVNLAHFARK